MTQITKDQQDIISSFQRSAPVNVTGLAEALGLAVFEDEDLPVGVSGKLCMDTDEGHGVSGYSVVVRASDPFVRKRFTVAHEIAHFLLHRDRIGASLTDDALYRSNLSTWEEVEANRLAADILMPRDLIAKFVQMYGNDPAVLGSFFKVSEQAMRIRLGMA